MVTMTAQEYTDLLLNYDPKSEEHRKAFEKITYRYPYFQSAYAHYLKSLKVQEQYNYNLILKKTAVLSPERDRLHHWLEDDKKTAPPVETPKEIEVAEPAPVVEEKPAKEAETVVPATEAPKEKPVAKKGEKEKGRTQNHEFFRLGGLFV